MPIKFYTTCNLDIHINILQTHTQTMEPHSYLIPHRRPTMEDHVAQLKSCSILHNWFPCLETFSVCRLPRVGGLPYLAVRVLVCICKNYIGPMLFHTVERSLMPKPPWSLGEVMVSQLSSFFFLLEVSFPKESKFFHYPWWQRGHHLQTLDVRF